MKYYDNNKVEINEAQYISLTNSGKRFHAKGDGLGKGGQIMLQSTPAFETERDAEEVQSVADKPARDLKSLRRIRDGLLKKTDHEAMSDRAMGQPIKDYRQALRDITLGNVDALLDEWRNRKTTPTTLWPTEPGA